VQLLRPSNLELPEPARRLRVEVREFLHAALESGLFVPRCDAWLAGHDPAFSRLLGERGWLGLSWPSRFGGGGRSPLDRYVVVEELLASGAPVAAHWMAERQVGPSLLRHGNDHQRQRFLPAIARGECFFSIGLSEPDSGSDLASITTAARPVEGGWRITGRKVWTSHAHRSQYLLTLCRTTPGASRHEGLSQFIVDLHAPGVSVRPVVAMTGGAHFCEVMLDDVFVPGGDVLGAVGTGWPQVISELAFERSGPERFLSTFPLLGRLAWGVRDDVRELEALGKLVAELQTLRRLSLAVAAQTTADEAPGVAAAAVKDLGTRFEREIIEAARLRIAADADPELARHYRDAVLASPSFSLRGGTTEIMRAVVAQGVRGR
jgi:alkylation response protein AidB-like acyl-CoA dehydrogenase